MKRNLLTAFVILVCCALLCSCGSFDLGETVDRVLDKVDSKIDSYSSDETAPTLKDKPTVFDSGEPELPEPAEESEPLAVFENGSVKLYVNGASMESWGYVLDVTAVNGSPHTLSFNTDGGMLDSLVLTPSMSFEVDSDSSAEAQVVWYSSALGDCAVGSVTCARFHFTAVSTDTDATCYAESFVTVYPDGEGAAARYELPSGSEYTEKFVKETESGIFSVSFDPCGYDGSNGYTLDVFLDNDSEFNAVYEITSAKLNGVESDPYWSRSVPAGCLEYANICWYGDPFADSGVAPEDINKVELKISVKNTENGSTLAELSFAINTTFETEN